MNPDPDAPQSGRADADEALAAVQRAGRVDFALRIAQSLQDAAAVPITLAIAFEDTVSRVVPPESEEGEARGRNP